MKRWMAMFFVMVCAWSLAGCGNSEANQLPKTPPTLTVTCGGQSTQALLGTYSWQYDNENGTITAVEACGGHALFDLDWMTPISRGESKSVTLDFTAEPESIRIRCWSDQYANDTDSYEANYTTLTCEDGTVEIPTDGGYIYEVKAEWDAGNANYSFYIVDESIRKAGCKAGFPYAHTNR